MATREIPEAVGSAVSSETYDRVRERRRAVALARHFREAEGLSNLQIAERLGRSPATIKAYFYDPTGAKARAVKARYVGVCRGCGAYTQPRNGEGHAYAYCKACHRRASRAALDTRARAGRDAPGGPATGWLPSTSASPIQVRRRTTTSSSLLQVDRRGSDGSVVSGGIGMSGSHTAGKSMLAQGGLIQSDFRKREEGKLAAVAFSFPSSSKAL